MLAVTHRPRAWRLSTRALLPCAILAVALATVASPATRRARAAPGLPRVAFTAPARGSILVHGTYPAVRSRCVRHLQAVLHARFSGRVEVGKDTDGSLFVIAEVPFEDYVKGIAEMPRTWPMAALQAQAVAARSYALANLRYGDPSGRRLGYQLCASTACQVFLGRGVTDGPYGNRWVQAVDSTSGQVLLYQGVPADTLYFSTSNGRTYSNSVVFGTSPLPYLRPIVERDDGGSSVSHWRLSVPFASLGRFLQADGAWPRVAVTSVRPAGADLIIRGPRATRRIGLDTVRGALNSWGPCLDPDHYPPTNLVNGTQLPQTVPSRWVRASVSGRSVVLTGRGWGHGVGMVQWGAEGKAARGLDARQILAAYYGGLQPVPYAEPATIRVGIATGLSSVTLVGTPGVTVSRATAGPGPWLVTGGRYLTVGQGTAPPASIGAGTLHAPARLRAGAEFTAHVAVPQLCVVQLEVETPAGPVDVSPRVTLQAGPAVLHGRVPTRTPSGAATIAAVVTNGVDIVRTPPRAVIVTGGGPPASPTPSPTPSASATHRPTLAAPAAGHGGGGGRWILFVAGIAAVLAALGLGAAAKIRARRRGNPGPWA